MREQDEAMKAPITLWMMAPVGLTLMVLLGMPSIAASQSSQKAGGYDREATDVVSAVVGRMDGLRNRGKHLVMFQRSLKTVGPIRVLRTRRFQQEARALRVSQVIPEDARALVDVAGAVNADAIIFVEISANQTNQNSARIRVGVYAGDDGRFMGETVVKMPSGQPSQAAWDGVANMIKPMLLKTVPQEDVGRVTPVARQVPGPSVPAQARAPSKPINDNSIAKNSVRANEGRPLIAVAAGPYSMTRTFKYTVAPESNRFTEGGIVYELGFVPGFCLELEIAPFARTNTAVQGLILGVGYEKVFFRTQQTIFTESSPPEVRTPTESRYSNLTIKLGYRFLMSAGIELDSVVGFGLRDFEIPGNDQYTGSRYTSLNLGLAGYVPFGTPYIGAQLQAIFMPVTGLGDTLQELGSDASTTGFSIRGGLESRIGNGLVLAASLDFSGYFVGITGEGRDGRIGQSATDSFLGLDLQVGYRF